MIKNEKAYATVYAIAIFNYKLQSLKDRNKNALLRSKY